MLILLLKGLELVNWCNVCCGERKLFIWYGLYFETLLTVQYSVIEVRVWCYGVQHLDHIKRTGGIVSLSCGNSVMDGTLRVAWWIRNASWEQHY